MACRDRMDDLCRLADGELAGPAVDEVRRHVARCDACRDTLRLLLAEAETIGAALGGRLDVSGPRRSGLRSWIAAALVLLLAGVGLLHLHGTYAAWAEKQAAKNAGHPPVALERTVAVSARGQPLPDYLRAVSSETGVSIVLSDTARERLHPDPLVHIVLSSPVRLGSILGLLRRFYELEADVRGEAVLLH